VVTVTTAATAAAAAAVKALQRSHALALQGKLQHHLLLPLVCCINRSSKGASISSSCSTQAFWARLIEQTVYTCSARGCGWYHIGLASLEQLGLPGSLGLEDSMALVHPQPPEPHPDHELRLQCDSKDPEDTEDGCGSAAAAAEQRH